MKDRNDTYLTRETLVKKLSNNQSEMAWQEFVELYRRYIYSIIRKKGVSVDETEDLLQSILLKIWKNIPQFELNQRKGSFRNWIGNISRNMTYNYLRRQNYIERKSEEAVFHADQFMGTDSEAECFMTEWKENIVALAFQNVSERVSSQSMEIFQACAKGEKATSVADRLNLPEHKVYRYRRRVEQLLTEEVKALRDMLE